MKTRKIAKGHILLAVLVTAGLLFQASSAWALNSITVVGHDRAADQTTPTGTTIIVDTPDTVPGDGSGNGFRWVLQEDATIPVTPGVAPPFGTAPTSGRFHPSHMPVIASGTSGDLQPLYDAVDVNKRYYVSVLPYVGYAMSGGPVEIGQTSLRIDVNSYPLPTAQISIQVFKEININGAPDFPQEEAASQGIDLSDFSVLLFDAAGQYGAAGGQILEDAFGNPLGTTYQQNPDGTPVLDGDGAPIVAVLGSGVVKSDADGNVLIKYLYPGKYGIQVVPPAGNGWVQTSTIEGSKTIDAWVRANEPPFFKEFGPPGPHVFIGFVQTGIDKIATNQGTQIVPGTTNRYADETRLAQTGGATLTGQVVNLHNARPPEVAFYNGTPLPHSACWVGLLDLALASSDAIYIERCDDNNQFSIPRVADGSYQLVIWDDYLVQIIAFYNVTVSGGGTVCSTPDGSCDLIEVPVFAWNHRLEHFAFLDLNEDGFPDGSTADGPAATGEVGLGEVNINVRFRDGRIYQAFPTDHTGYVPFDEMFPFFSWFVAEVDFARFKATGVTYIVDAGGPIPADLPNFWDMPAHGTQNPQPQPDNGNLPYRTISGADAGAPPLLLGFQGFLGQNNTFYWGKKPYAVGENGGISGVVFYAVTRAEDDPAYGAAEEWEPGIPRVQVNLYEDFDGDGIIDDQNGNGTVEAADVDNYPLGNFPGPEDVNNTDVTLGYTAGFDMGDAIRVTHTDSWDDNQPTGCVYDGPAYSLNGETLDCFDNLRNYNQIREAVFDGGYAFGTVADITNPLQAGIYIVETATPPGYVLMKEEDRNVDFGDVIVPAPNLLPAPCVGDPHTVQAYMSMQTDAAGNPLPGITDPTPAPFAGENRPLCSRKQVRLADRSNAAADFFLFTHTPVASQGWGFSLNDLANELNPASPQWSEKFAPPYIPVGVRDWTGRLLSKTYTDGFGRYDLLVPSSYNAAGPFASGFSPNMLQICMNDPLKKNPAFDGTDPLVPEYIADDFFDPQYSQFCYTLMFMPGATTYLDTPVLPVAAFASGKQPDCECEDGTPEIYSVTSAAGGPVLPAMNVSGSGNNQVRTVLGGNLTIDSRGTVAVPNPAYVPPDPLLGPGPEPKTILRDYGFGGTQGTVTLDGVPLTIVSWTDASIVATVPAGGAPRAGQLMVTRGDNGNTTKVGVSVQLGFVGIRYGNGGNAPRIDQMVRHVPGDYSTIQAAIDAAAPGDIVMVAPGTYNEQVIMWKPVALQGWGAGSVTLDAQDPTGDKLVVWRAKLAEITACNGFQALPAQADFTIEESGGILVLNWMKNALNVAPCVDYNALRIRESDIPNPRIDGIKVVGATGGGINVNGLVQNLHIGNDRFENNSGPYSGAIRSGSPVLTDVDGNGLPIYVDAQNNHLDIHHNEIVRNAVLSAQGSGGGVSLFTGSNHYSVADNRICGNFSNGYGGGISHLGFNDGGDVDADPTRNLIARNTVIFNQSFAQGLIVAGGGISIRGQAPLAATVAYGPGAGSTVVDKNLIQGNHGAAGAGGGIYVDRFNGADIADNGSNNPDKWFTLDITNNIVANNVAGAEAGGISLQDAVLTTLHHNTVANNDSTATTGATVLPSDPNTSIPQPAGLVSHAHTSEIVAALSAGGVWNNASFPNIQDFSRPAMSNNIIWHNRSFHFGLAAGGGYELVASVPENDDLGVIGTPLGVVPCMDPQNSILTDLGEDLPVCDYSVSGTNGTADPLFVFGYQNGDTSVTLPQQFPTVALPQVGGAADEGGNFLDVRYGPLALGASDYHIQDASPAIGAGNLAVVADQLTTDFDGDARPAGLANPDIGADENPN